MAATITRRFAINIYKYQRNRIIFNINNNNLMKITYKLPRI